MSDDTPPATSLQRRMFWDTSRLRQAVPFSPPRSGGVSPLLLPPVGMGSAAATNEGVVTRALQPATAAYLIARQSADELRKQVDSEDVDGVVLLTAAKIDQA
jgi:hypothetical protein